VRVIAGKFRSRRLKGPGTLRLRPTSDRLRETLFNILGPAVEDSLFIDVYAGTGAIGMEAISRGARQVILIESNPRAARLIRDNLAALEIFSGAQLMEADALTGLKKLSDHRSMADFIFHRSGTELPERLGRLECTRQLEQGDATLSFYRLAAAA